MVLFSKVSVFSNSRLFVPITGAAIFAGTLLLIGATSPAFDTELVSIGLDGQAGQSDTFYASSEIRAGAVSADGRFVAFSSLADNLTAHDVSGWQVYLRDRVAATTTLVSDTGAASIYGSSSEGHAVISADGRFVAFQSTNGQLVANDTNGSSDIFVFDRADGSLERVSVASDGTEACPCSCSWPDTCNGCEYHWLNTHPAISADGRFVAFTSFSYNLVAGDLPDTPDVFVHDRQTGTTTLVSLAADGNIGNAASGEPGISAAGDAIVFSSHADNLIVEDWNAHQDVFLWQRDTGAIVRLSVASDGSEGNSASTDPVISADGKRVAFTSGATTLDAADSNGFTYDVFVRDLDAATTTLMSANLPGGGRRPAISGDGEAVTFTSGTDDVYRVDVETGQRMTVDLNMQFSALDNGGEAVALSGYASLLGIDTNNDKDVYLVSLDEPAPPGDAEVCDDGIDNDGDGLIDCLDKKDCRQHPACKTTGGGGGGGGSGGGGGGGKNR